MAAVLGKIRKLYLKKKYNKIKKLYPFLSLLSQWLPESARYDVARGHMDAAMETLQRIAKDNGKPMPLGKLIDSGNPEGNDIVSSIHSLSNV